MTDNNNPPWYYGWSRTIKDLMYPVEMFGPLILIVLVLVGVGVLIGYAI